jgi:hypothetical protein
MRKPLFAVLVLLFLPAASSFAQGGYWQQQVSYRIAVKMNVQTNRLEGTERLAYTNHSPDTLRRVFFHLYWNAFQPGSMMDVRSRQLGKIVLGLDARGDSVRDWDPRVRDRILHLSPSEIGYDSVLSIRMDGRPQQMIYHETILEVPLDTPLLPGGKVTFDMRFKCQVPVQIRRSGRDNAEGVRYSMSQWYPKISEYDFRGWHADPYVAREFYGVWGDYDVKITIDSSYLIGATGYLQNAGEIGFGYEKPGVRVKRPAGDRLTWHFYAPRVHDFVWAADPGYTHISAVADNAAHTVINVIYKADGHNAAAWHNLLTAALRVLPFMEKHFGAYPFRQYSFIQGGDGGMEYPMATLIKGPSLGTAFHEWMHSWYQFMMGTNEQLVPWMDEGFATWAEGKVSFYYYHAYADSVFRGKEKERQAFLARLDTSLPLGESGSYKGYYMLVRSGLAEPMTTQADHYSTNFGYEENAYSKGAVFLEQLGYIVGDSVLGRILLAYYRTWRFKHPDANDFIRVAEKVSGMQLGWYLEYFIRTTKVIDYGIDSVSAKGGRTRIVLRRIGEMPMPIDLVVTYKDGHQEIQYIPMYMMFGVKPNEHPRMRRKVYPAWPWTNPTYALTLPAPLSAIRSVEIDPTRRMADIDRSNNCWQSR